MGLNNLVSYLLIGLVPLIKEIYPVAAKCGVLHLDHAIYKCLKIHSLTQNEKATYCMSENIFHFQLLSLSPHFFFVVNTC